jgi:hypothetical protein
MPIPKNLEAQFAKAAQAKALKQAQERERLRAEARSRRAERREDRRLMALAGEAVKEIWAWLQSPEAEALRELAARHGFDEVRLIGRIEWRWRVLLPCEPGQLRVWQIRGPMAVGTDSVSSPKALLRVLNPERIALLAETLGSGKVYQEVADGLASW